MANTAAPLVELKNIDLTFNPGTVNETCLFRDFNFRVDRGEFVSVVGSNGSGKTSMLNLICGTLNPESGHILLADNKGKAYGLSRGVNQAKKEEYRTLLSQLHMGLEDKLDVAVGSLSGGQRQALALLIATMTPIDLLILDEHTAALDPKSSETVMDLTLKTIEEKNLTALMVTHNLRFATDYGTRIVMMHEGRAHLDSYGRDKSEFDVDYLLKEFTQISIELGN